MSGITVYTVLRCEECNKPFDKEATLKRHRYYCRSIRNGPTVRPRSCVACAKSKTRCDNKQPMCTRCSVKTVKCHYPPILTKSTKSDPQANQARSVSSHSDRPASTEDVVAQSSTETPGFDVAGLDNLSFSSNLSNYDFNGFKLFSTQNDNDQEQLDNPEPLAQLLTPPSGSRQSQMLGPQVILPTFAIPEAIQNYYSLLPRSRKDAGTARVTKMILQSLRTYPMMMLRDNALPPYIHTSLPITEDGTGELEPVYNCMSLLHMLNSQIRGSRKLFWRNVRTECEIIFQESVQMGKWALLAAMQALSIYIIVRLEEAACENDIDSLLVNTVIALSKSIGRGFDGSPDPARSAVSSDWSNWIFEESSRRLCVVYKVISLLVHFEPIALCDLKHDLVIAPLPARRQLWEAENESSWAAELHRLPKSRQSCFGLAKDGEIVKLQEDEWRCGSKTAAENTDDVMLGLEYGDPVAMTHGLGLVNKPKDFTRRAANWEEWQQSMDGLGGIVLLAASLPND